MSRVLRPSQLGSGSGGGTINPEDLLNDYFTATNLQALEDEDKFIHVTGQSPNLDALTVGQSVTEIVQVDLELTDGFDVNGYAVTGDTSVQAGSFILVKLDDGDVLRVRTGGGTNGIDGDDVELGDFSNSPAPVADATKAVSLADAREQFNSRVSFNDVQARTSGQTLQARQNIDAYLPQMLADAGLLPANTLTSETEPDDEGQFWYNNTVTPQTLSKYNAVLSAWVPVTGSDLWNVDDYHPFRGTSAVVTTYTTHTFWPVGFWFDDVEQRHYRAFVVSVGHVTDSGTRLQIEFSEDGGSTWAGNHTVYSNGTVPIGAGGAIGKMANGRYGGIISAWASENYVAGDRTAIFVYTDNLGERDSQGDLIEIWTHETLTGITIDHFVHGQLQPTPTVAGGDDALGFSTTSYAGTKAAKRIWTTDNGATWLEGVVKSGDATVDNPQETSEVFAEGIGSICFARTGGNVFACTSPSGIVGTYGPWVDTGVLCGENVINTVVKGGILYLTVMMREDFGGSTDENTLLVYKKVLKETYEDDGVMSDAESYVVGRFPSRSIGYMYSAIDQNGSYSHAFKVGESAQSSQGFAATASWALISETQLASDLTAPDLGVQIIDNPYFEVLDNGLNFAAPVDGEITANRWSVVLSGATMPTNWIEAQFRQRLAQGHRPLGYLELDTTNDPDNFAGIIQTWRGQDAADLINLLAGTSDLNIIMTGVNMPPRWRVLMTIDFDAAGVTNHTLTREMPQAYAENGGSWWTQDKLTIPIRTDYDVGPDPTVTVRIDNGNSTAPFKVGLTSVLMFIGRAPVETLPVFREGQIERCALYQGRITDDSTVGPGQFTSATTFRAGIKLDCPVAPTITVNDPTEFLGFNSASFPASSITATSVTKDGFNLDCAVTGAPAGEYGHLKMTGSNTAINYRTGF